MDFCPLIDLKACGQESLFLWIDDMKETSLKIKITDGYKVWEQSLQGGVNKPKSRKENDREYISLVITCLQNLDCESRDCKITTTASGGLQLLIREKLGSMMALLLKLDLNENLDALTTIRNILRGACDSCAQSSSSLSDAMHEIQQHREANDTLSQTILGYAKSKDEFQNDFFRKMCLLLNTKKREVRRLQDELFAMEEEVNSLRASVKNKSANTVSKITKKKAHKPKRVEEDEEVAEEEEDDDEHSLSDGHVSYSLQSDDEMSSQDSMSEKELSDTSEAASSSHKGLAKSKAKSKTNKRKPPSYAHQDTQGLKKPRSQGSTQANSQSQVISQVLSSSSGLTETTGSDLTRILTQTSKSDASQNKKRGRPKRNVVDTQEDSYDEDTIPSTISTYTYEDANKSETPVSNIEDNNPVVNSVTRVAGTRKPKKSAFDKLYNNDSSSEEEEDSLMNYM